MTLQDIERFRDIYDPQAQSELVKAARVYPAAEVIKTIIQVDSVRRAIQYGTARRIRLEPASRADWEDPRLADGVPILARKPQNVVKINHKSHTPYSRIIVSQKANYFVGKPPTINPSEGPLVDWLLTNSFPSLLLALAGDAAAMGEGFTLLYSPPGVNEAYITQEVPYNCVVLYDPDINEPVFGLLYYQRSDDVIDAYWYTETEVMKFEGKKGSGFVLVEAPEAHLFEGVPLIEWPNNAERIGDLEPVLGLMDLYDIVDSDFLSELSQLRLAYFVLKGFGLSGDPIGESIFSKSAPGFEDVDRVASSLTKQLQETGTFTTENPDASADFVTKPINFEAVQYAKVSLKERIFRMANSYDPEDMKGSGASITAFQIRMKLISLDLGAQDAITHFSQSFRRLANLLSGYYQKYKGQSIPMDGAEIIFRKNIPSNITQDMIDARAAGAALSQKQIIERLPFAVDYEENLQELLDEQSQIFEQGPGRIEFNDPS